ncbi:MAG: oligoendopeptidase F, partial [Longicatena sp.]|nr:oligoendopeptidase F [Longicatena sp.]
MKRNEIETSLTWDLSSMFETQEAYDQTYAEAAKNLEVLCEMKGSIASSKANFIAFMNQKELVTRQISNLAVYAHMFTDVDPDNE